MSTWPSTEELLPQITVPCFLYAGEQDPFHDGMKEAVNHIPDASFVSLSGLDHGEAAFRIDLLVHSLFPRVKSFLSQATY
jgi:hypothetical protein